MSGPKVINIEAVQRRLKRRGTRRAMQLRNIAVQYEARFQTGASNEALAQLKVLEAQEDWINVINMADAQIRFFEEECERGDRQLAQAATRESHRRHAIQKAASQLLVQSGDQIPAALRKSLAHQDFTVLETALFEAQTLLHEQYQQHHRAALQEEASFYAEISEIQNIRTRFSLPSDPQEQRWQRCHELLGQLSLVLTDAQLQGFHQKIQAIEALTPSQRALHLDSWTLELSKTLQDQRARLETLDQIRLLVMEMESSEDVESQALKLHLESLMLENADLLVLQTALKNAETHLEARFEASIQAEQRRVILEALAKAGYEIREGMQTAWVEQGRLVVHKPNETTYGVELSVSSQNSKVQTRVVALHRSPRDPQRDQEVEESWCSDFEAARDVIADKGFEATLLLAKAAGSVPIKIVEGTVEQARIQSQLKLRTFPSS